MFTTTILTREYHYDDYSKVHAATYILYSIVVFAVISIMFTTTRLADSAK